MAIGVILGIVFAVLCIGGITGAIVFNGKSKAIMGSSIAAAVAGAILFICIPFSFRTVETGEVAAVKYLGEVREVRTAGTYFDFWMTESYVYYDSTVQDLSIFTQAYSNDAQTMDVEMTVQYQIDTSKVVDIANTYGQLDILNSRIESVAVDAMKSVMAENTAEQIIENRAQLSMNVTSTIMDRIDSSYYVNVQTVVLTDIGFTDAYEAAVEAQMIAEREKEAAIIKAEQELETAKLEAQAVLEAAQGEANAQKALAEAEAYSASIKIVQLAQTLGYKVTEVASEDGALSYSIDWGEDTSGRQAITEYIQYLEYLSKWNGELPGVVAGDGNGVMITIPSMDSQDNT